MIHRMIKESEDFATMVKVAAKNLCSYVSLVKFLQDPFLEWMIEKENKLRKMQYDLFNKEKGVFLQTQLREFKKPHRSIETKS